MDPHTLNRLRIRRRGWQLCQPRLWHWQRRGGFAAVSAEADGASWCVRTVNGDVAARGIVPWLETHFLTAWAPVLSAMLYAEMELAHLNNGPLWDGEAA